MSMDLGILSVSEMVSGGYDHERWEAKPSQYYLKYCERVWSCERIVNACFGRSLRALQLRVAARVSHGLWQGIFGSAQSLGGADRSCTCEVLAVALSNAPRRSVTYCWSRLATIPIKFLQVWARARGRLGSSFFETRGELSAQDAFSSRSFACIRRTSGDLWIIWPSPVNARHSHLCWR